MKTDNLICELISYSIGEGLIEESDRAFYTGRLMELLSLDEYLPDEKKESRPLADILSDICDYAKERRLIPENTVTYRDLFDMKIMGALMDRPSAVTKKFYDLYEESPEAATDYFYSLSLSSNHIRRDRIAKDLKWSPPRNTEKWT